MELWKAIWHAVFDFFSELFDEKPWQEKDTKSKLKILGALLLGAILTFIFYILYFINRSAHTVSGMVCCDKEDWQVKRMPSEILLQTAFWGRSPVFWAGFSPRANPTNRFAGRLRIHFRQARRGYSRRPAASARRGCCLPKPFPNLRGSRVFSVRAR